MAPKRKAANAAEGRSSKRVASGMNTPVSIGSDGSDDEYSDIGDVEETEETPQRFASQYHRDDLAKIKD